MEGIVPETLSFWGVEYDQEWKKKQTFFFAIQLLMFCSIWFTTGLYKTVLTLNQDMPLFQLFYLPITFHCPIFVTFPSDLNGYGDEYFSNIAWKFVGQFVFAGSSKIFAPCRWAYSKWILPKVGYCLVLACLIYAKINKKKCIYAIRVHVYLWKLANMPSQAN